MTESEWNTSTDPDKMLEFLLGKASDRKLRLFGSAVVQRVWSLLTHEDGKNVVILAEWFADGFVHPQALRLDLPQEKWTRS